MQEQNTTYQSKEQVTEIGISEIFHMLMGHLWQVAACVFAGALVSFLITLLFITPQYVANSKIYIVSASNESVVNLSDLQIGSNLTNDYKSLLKNLPLLEDVITNLNLKMSPDELSNMITINNPTDTRILNIEVTSSNPEQAMNIANELTTQAIIYLPRIMECETPNIVQNAILPKSPSSPSYSRNIVTGAMLGFILILAFYVIRHMTKDSIDSAEDLEKYFGITPLSVIPEIETAEPGRFKKAKKTYSRFETLKRNIRTVERRPSREHFKH